MRKALIMLGELSDSDIEWLSDAGSLRTLPAGARLIEEGQPIGAFFIILDGQAAVRVRDTQIALLAAGELLGEISMIDSRPPAASVVAVTDVILLAIAIGELKRKLAGDLAFGCRFYHAVAILLADRLRGTNARLGYGAAGAMTADAELEDEIDLGILDKLHLAGRKFDQLLKLNLKAQ